MKLSKQQQRVLDILKEKGYATAREIIAVTNYPSSLIRDLKAKGIKIETRSIPNKNYDYYELAQ